MKRTTISCSFLLLCLGVVACGEAATEGESGGDSPLAPGVGQGGAQDFGLFRQILEDGEIPGPDTIDDVGFFNEHKLELPDPECGDSVCLHGMLGVMGNMISGSNCTLVMIGMNTAIDPDKIERPPLNLSIVIDTSGSMQGAPIEYVRSGLTQVLEHFEPEDRINLVGFSTEAEVMAEQVAPAALWDAIQDLEAAGDTNIYDGLRVGFDLVAEHADEGRQNRVLFLSDGKATAGIVDGAQIIDMSRAYNELGIGLSTIGMGEGFDATLLRDLAEAGSGAFYFLEDPAAVDEVFTEEATSFLVPLAEDVHVGVDIEGGYDLRAVYGTKLFEVSGNTASIEIPILQIAHRESTETDPGEGRRGGGGAMILELLPTGENPADVGMLTFDYRDVQTGDIVTQHIGIASPLAPWETPTAGWWSDDRVEKAFVMLNIYVGFEIAATRADVGEDAEAMVVLEALAGAVEGWLAEHPDDDIEDDLFYLNLFIENLDERSDPPQSPNPQPPEPWPSD